MRRFATLMLLAVLTVGAVVGPARDGGHVTAEASASGVAQGAPLADAWGAGAGR
ncbi:hypothetical protein [Demequina gelatinilytica]|uniref:hypothetical protein n=1 Tax=Demequina gelatinilytica TaxID=1638980 RepID=UPI000ACA431D|nr:hypothetical protein [Demequina gelatinilytica]